MQDWNDLRLVLAIRRSGSLAGAATALAVNHSTVFRRLGALEQSLGARLFERLPGGLYEATAAGERMAAAAERIETETAALDREIAGGDHRLTGSLRVTASETLAYRLLTPLIGRFRAEHPGITVELVIDNRVLSLSRREADVALRVTRPREGELHGRKLANIAWSIYAARPMARRLGPRRNLNLDGVPLIGWETGAADINAAAWLQQHSDTPSVVYRTNSLVNQLIAAKAGIGAAVLPCYLGDPESDLVCLAPEPIPALDRELWIVTHADLRGTARVRAFFDTVTEGVSAARGLLAGGNRRLPTIKNGGEHAPRRKGIAKRARPA